MISLYGRYIAEREGMGVVEREHGFATYKIEGNSIYLRDLFIVPGFRKTGIAKSIADYVCEIGKAHKCTQLIGSISPQDPNATDGLKVLLAYGMRLQSVTPNLILFVKEIS